MNSAGYTTRNGVYFTKQGVEFIAKNQIYTGTLIYNKQGGKKKKTRLLLQDYEEVVVEDAFPPIIDKATFEEVQNIIENKRKIITYDTNHIYLLSGLIYCSSCKKVMVGSSNTGGRSKSKRYYYQCPSHKAKACDNKAINAEYIENYVLDIVTPLANKFLIKSNVGKSVKPQIKETKRLINKIEKDIEKNNRQCEAYYIGLSQVLSNEFLKTGLLEKIEESIKLNKKLNEDLELLKLKVIMLDGLITSNVKLSKEDLLKDRLKARTLCKILIDKIIVDEASDEIKIIIR